MEDSKKVPFTLVRYSIGSESLIKPEKKQMKSERSTNSVRSTSLKKKMALINKKYAAIKVNVMMKNKDRKSVV